LPGSEVRAFFFAGHVFFSVGLGVLLQKFHCLLGVQHRGCCVRPTAPEPRSRFCRLIFHAECTSRFPQAETAFRAGFLFPLRDFLAQEGAPTGSPVDIYFFAQILIFAEPVFLPLKGQPSRSPAWSGDRLWALAVIARLPAAASFPCSRSTECTGRSPGFLLAFC
jgi:hypothetical protein